jgi:Holliday junction resolvase RusA-like endonuclease
MIQFFMPMKPPTATAQMHRVVVSKGGAPVFYDPPAVLDARAKLTAHLAGHRPPAPLEGSLRLTTKWCFPVTRRHKSGEYKYTKPDTDNLQKLLKDCMTAVGFWGDDAQVASEITEKFWADKPGIWIKVESVK